MYNNHKLIACIPTGRRLYMRILIPYLKRALEQDNLDEVHFWMNTSVQSDIDYVRKICTDDTRFIMVTNSDTDNHNDRGRATCVSFFYKYCLELNTIYFKIDDDIVYISQGVFTKLAEVRLRETQFFVIFPQIINTVFTSFLLQQHGRLQTDPPIGGYNESYGYPECYRGGVHSLDAVAWGDPRFAAYLHQLFVQNHNADHWKIRDEILHDYAYISINFFCWLGSDFAEWGGVVTPGNDENEINYEIPKRLNKVNLIVGDQIVSHYAFYSQRKFLDSINTNEWYEKLLRKENLEVYD